MVLMVDTDTKIRWLTRRRNNTLTAVLGIPALAYAMYALATSGLSDRAAFAGMVAIGAVY